MRHTRASRSGTRSVLCANTQRREMGDGGRAPGAAGRSACMVRDAWAAGGAPPVKLRCGATSATPGRKGREKMRSCYGRKRETAHARNSLCDDATATASAKKWLIGVFGVLPPEALTFCAPVFAEVPHQGLFSPRLAAALCNALALRWASARSRARRRAVATRQRRAVTLPCTYGRTRASARTPARWRAVATLRRCAFT